MDILRQTRQIETWVCKFYKQGSVFKAKYKKIERENPTQNICKFWV